MSNDIGFAVNALHFLLPFVICRNVIGIEIFVSFFSSALLRREKKCMLCVGRLIVRMYVCAYVISVCQWNHIIRIAVSVNRGNTLPMTTAKRKICNDRQNEYEKQN